MTSSKDDNVFDYKTFLASAPEKPGVYYMRDKAGKALYIGKAKNIKNRLASYFNRSNLATKTIALINKIDAIELIVTYSETEALLLEQNLIKKHHPQYNILLKDDKSYPYIFISSKHKWPRVAFFRGKRKHDGDYFGPYPNSNAVRESLNLLQKIFKVRQCSDSYFRNRSRPCLQYQIKRCKAPCVSLVSEEEYHQDVQDTVQFLSGKSTDLLSDLSERMDAAAKALNFEQAAEVRNQISYLRKIIEKQVVEKSGGNIDVIGYSEQAGTVCFSILFIRKGQLIGNKNYLPAYRLEGYQEQYTSQFLAQFYIHLADNRDFPSELIISEILDEQASLCEAITRVAGKKVQIKHAVRGDRLLWLTLANKNARQYLTKALSDKVQVKEKARQLQKLLKLDAIPERIECFDISHTMGEATVASCVVFGKEGPVQSEYRSFNIAGITPGDDYAAMRQALTRRYQKIKQGNQPAPDLILIDGGRGQLGVAKAVMTELELSNIPLLGVAKGVTRKPGMETLIFQGENLLAQHHDLALLFIQHIRDEAHRFAITGHRTKRQKARNRSILEDIPGIGSTRRAALLKFFGGRQGVIEADITSLMQVPGINQKLAQTIHDFLHEYTH